VRHVGLLCGPDPGVKHRADATNVLLESLSTLCETISAFPNMRLMIEPLDRDVHKLDPSSPVYGDHHIPPGPSGVQDVQDFARAPARVAESGVLAEKKPIVSVEVRTAPGDDPRETVHLCRQTMSRVLHEAARAASV